MVEDGVLLPFLQDFLLDLGVRALLHGALDVGQFVEVLDKGLTTAFPTRFQIQVYFLIEP